MSIHQYLYPLSHRWTMQYSGSPTSMSVNPPLAPVTASFCRVKKLMDSSVALGDMLALGQQKNRFSFQVNSLHPLQAVPLDLCRVCSTLVLVVPRLLDLDLPAVPDKNTEFLRRSASCWVPWMNKWCILGSSTRIHHGRTVYFLQRFPHVPRKIRLINEAKQSYWYTMAERTWYNIDNYSMTDTNTMYYVWDDNTLQYDWRVLVLVFMFIM